MSNPYSLQLQVQDWMLAQMSNYPPPPQPDQQHYAGLYAASAGAQQLLDPSSQDQLQYSHLAQPPYPKIESTAPSQTSSDRPIQSLAEELQHHAANEEQQRQQQQQQQHQQQQQQQQQHQQHQQHQLQHAPHQPQHVQQPPMQQPTFNAPGQASPATLPQTLSDSAQKSNRLRKACDSCSIRKVKCDEAGPPCRACAALDIPCTFDRPSRRRGPPNRHAEAIKRRRLEEAAGGVSPHMSGRSSPASPTHAAQALAALSSHPSNQQLSAEAICPVDTLELLIDDFFTYIHPLCPFPHEPSFREAWKRREDYSNKAFLALLASMIGTLVASFPRRPKQHLKMQQRESLFPNHMALVDRCQKICALARGPGYLENESLNVYDAATSYFLALTGAYTFRWRQGRLYFGECLNILRTLGLHKSKSQNQSQGRPFAASGGSQNFGSDSGHVSEIDNITLEMGRRIFWTLFVSIKTTEQLGATFGELVIPPPTPSDPYPPLPAEVDDFCIFPTHNDPQPPGLLPIIAGFNANCRVFTSYNALATMESAWGIDSLVDWDRQKRVLQESLRRCKGSISGLPAELSVSPNPGITNQQHNGDNFYPSFGHAGALPFMSPNGSGASQEDRRRIQCEIQKANIHASSLCTRSYIVEKFWDLTEAHSRARVQKSNSLPGSPSTPTMGLHAAGIDGMVPQVPTSHYDMTEHEMREEKESIMKDLLTVLGSINQVNMEPNADSFAMKIRTIASTLLDGPNQRKGQVTMQAQEYLTAFLDIIMKLERMGPSSSDPGQPIDEETELRHWADLREYQMKFAQQGSLLGV
ncbi:hypothetical protein MBLNU230_g0944t1 [Neophaeotheca triangularis]